MTLEGAFSKLVCEEGSFGGKENDRETEEIIN